MRKLILPFFLCLSACTFGQNASKRNDVYAEFLGNGIYASLNYERQLGSRPGLGIRAGVGYFSGDEKFRVSIPLAVQYLLKINERGGFLDMSLGATWSGAAGLKKDDPSGVRDDNEHIWSLVPGVGYRHHTKGNFMWRASLTPLINKYRTVPYIGLSFGKRF